MVRHNFKIYTLEEKRDNLLLLCVHDEIVLECSEDELEAAECLLKEAMVQSCRDFLKVVAIPEPDPDIRLPVVSVVACEANS